MGLRLGRQTGFTLGELLTTIAVLGIGMSLAVPSFETAVRNNRRATAVNRLVSTMHLARSEAVTRNMQVTICASSDGASCDTADWSAGWIYFTDADRDRALDADDNLLGTTPAQTALEIDSAEFTSYFAYRPNGRVMVDTPAENSGEFTFCDERGAEFARVVIVATSGQPRLSEHQANGSDPVCPEA